MLKYILVLVTVFGVDDILSSIKVWWGKDDGIVFNVYRCR